MAEAQMLSKLTGFYSFVHQLDPRIQSLILTKERLEGRKYNIINFTIQFCKKNSFLGHMITRMVVEFFWTNEIWRLYPDDHPEKRRLIGQAHSPKYEVYWQRQLNDGAFKAKRVRQSSADIWSFPRQLSKDEQKDKGVVLLGNHDWEYILPEVQLMPLYNVFFLDLATKTVAANPGKPFGIELMRRLWRLLIREVYDFVSEAEKTAKLEEAQTVTDDEFEKATGAVPETLSKKRGILSESDPEAEPSKRRSRRSKKKITVQFLETGESSRQTGIGELEPGSSKNPKASTATDNHRPVTNSESLVQDTKIHELTRRNAELTAKLAAAQRQAIEYKGARDLAERRLRSQHGQLQAAERNLRELRRANPDLAHCLNAKNEAEHKLKRQSGELRKSKENSAELRAEKYKNARLEASLAKAEYGAKGKEAMEAGVEVSYK